MKIASETLEDLERVGSGCFGTVYKKDDKTAYKIYHKYVFDQFGTQHHNPCLIYRKKHLNKLINLNYKLVHNNLISDVIFVDGIFKGVTMPYYNGYTLDNMMEANFNLKMDVSKQLVRNAKELTDNNIYPLDYKLNNLMYENGNARIIDLDDSRTKLRLIKDFYASSRSIKGLDETIKVFFGDTNCLPVKYRNLIDKEQNNISNKYELINEYLDKKNIGHNYIVVDELTDINYLLSFLKNNDCRVIFKYNYRIHDENYFLDVINKYQKMGIRLYDFVKDYNEYTYFSNCSILDKYEAKNKVLIKK